MRKKVESRCEPGEKQRSLSVPSLSRSLPLPTCAAAALDGGGPGGGGSFPTGAGGSGGGGGASLGSCAGAGAEALTPSPPPAPPSSSPATAACFSTSATSLRKAASSSSMVWRGRLRAASVSRRRIGKCEREFLFSAHYSAFSRGAARDAKEVRSLALRAGSLPHPSRTRTHERPHGGQPSQAAKGGGASVRSGRRKRDGGGVHRTRSKEKPSRPRRVSLPWPPIQGQGVRGGPQHAPVSCMKRTRACRGRAGSGRIEKRARASVFNLAQSIHHSPFTRPSRVPVLTPHTHKRALS